MGGAKFPAILRIVTSGTEKSFFRNRKRTGANG
jgi:hypothetical protein